MTCEEAEELITGLVDGQLLVVERAALENHFTVCTRCRFLYAKEQNLKKAIHAAGAELRASPAMKARLASDPRIFGTTAAAGKQWTRRLAGEHPRLRGALAAAVLLMLLVPTALRTQRGSAPISILAVQSYRQFLDRDNLAIKTKDLSILRQALTHAVGGDFQPMAYDFSMMRTVLVGGTIQEISGRPVMVTRYEGPGGTILCYTFLGTEADSPAIAAIFNDTEKQINFYAFSVGSMNAVLHREDKVICILASEMAMAELVDLARSKAKPHKHL